MIIKSLQLHNFKSHPKSKIEFPAGISIIMGENGAGKSSILEAVSFALFKSYSARNLPSLIKTGEKKLRVVLKFLVNGKTYRVTRERSKSASRAVLEQEDRDGFHQIATGDKVVSTEIESLLEMDSSLFLNAVYIRQGEIADLIDKKPSEKKQLIGKLLGIESLENAWKNMVPLIGHYSSEEQFLKGKMESKETWEKKLADKMEEKNKRDVFIGELNQEIEAIHQEIEQLKTDKEKLDEKKLEYREIKSSLDSLENILKGLKEDKDSLKKDLSRIKEDESKISKLETEILPLSNLVLLQKGLNNLNIHHQTEKQILSNLKKVNDLNQVLVSNKIFQEEYHNIEKKIESLLKDKEKFEGTPAIIRSLISDKDKTKQEIDQLNQQINETFSYYNQILESNLDSAEEIDSLHRKLEIALNHKLNLLDQELQDKKGTLLSLKNQNQQLKKPLEELKEVEDKCPICQSDISKSKKTELVTIYQEDITSNKMQMVALEESIEKLDNEKEELQKRKNSFQKINMDILQEKIKARNTASHKMSNLEMKLEDLKIQNIALEEIESSIKSKKSRLKEIENHKENYFKAKHSLENLDPVETLEKEKNSLVEKIIEEDSRIKELLSSLDLDYFRQFKEDYSLLDSDILQEEIDKREEFKNNLNQLKGRVSQKNSISEKLQKKKLDLEENMKNKESLHSSLIKIEYDAIAHQKILQAYEQKKDSFIELTSQKSKNEGIQGMTISAIEDLQKDLDSLKDVEKELDNLKDFIKVLDYIRKLFGKDGVQKDLRNRSRPLIQEEARKFFDRFNFEYSDISLDEDYEVEVFGPGGKTTLDMISGGEKIAVALALRLAITRVLSGGKLELIMLDEPTIHLDSYRRQELIDILKRLSVLPQMIIVTHDSDLEEAADNIIKVKKEEGESRVILDVAQEEVPVI
ncbi:MAG: AAA family ATPase [Euryarchaeota archaeon]